MNRNYRPASHRLDMRRRGFIINLRLRQAVLSRRNVLFAAALLAAAILPSRPHAAEKAGFIGGQLLVASPEMRDPRFVETVIYMVRHNAEGAFGLVINRPLAKGSIEDLLKGFGVESQGAKGEIVVHYGGPVSTTHGFVLHSDDVLVDNSTKIKDGVAVTSDPKLMQAIARGKGPRQSLFMLGYAGWAPGQLEAELKINSWYVVPGNRAFIFGKEADKKWRQAMDKRRIEL